MNIVSCAVVLFFSIGLGLAVKTRLIMSEVSYRARTVGKVYDYNEGITINKYIAKGLKAQLLCYS